MSVKGSFVPDMKQGDSAHITGYGCYCWSPSRAKWLDPPLKTLHSDGMLLPADQWQVLEVRRKKVVLPGCGPQATITTCLERYMHWYSNDIRIIWGKLTTGGLLYRRKLNTGSVKLAKSWWIESSRVCLFWGVGS